MRSSKGVHHDHSSRWLCKVRRTRSNSRIPYSHLRNGRTHRHRGVKEVHRIGTTTNQAKWETHIYGGGGGEGVQESNRKPEVEGSTGRTVELVVGDCESHV